MNSGPAANVRGKNTPMKRLLIILLTLFAVPAFAADGPGTTLVRANNDTIGKLIKEKVEPGSDAEKKLSAKITDAARGFLDIDELGKRAMVDQWGKLSAAQQKEFLSTLHELIEENYIKGLRSNVDYTIDYTGETTDKTGDITVTTQINTKRHNRPYKIEIDYVLRKDGGKLRAWDVKTDGVGLVENYRTQFNKIVEKDGFTGLIAKMKKKQTAQGT